MFLIALLKMVMEKKKCYEEGSFCRMVVGAEYRERIGPLIAVALMVFLHFGIYWVL